VLYDFVRLCRCVFDVYGVGLRLWCVLGVLCCEIVCCVLRLCCVGAVLCLCCVVL
jgi:hypothetical protein